MHSSPRAFSRLALLVAAPLLLIALASGCSSDKDDDSKDTTTTTATSGGGGGGENAQTVAFDKDIQSELAAVGCYSGGVDGIIGPETDAAIIAFQKASGLTPDGELGPETDSALTKDVDDGKKDVCSGSTTTTTTGGSTTTTTGGGGSGAPCTATAIQAGLPSGTTLTSYVCAGGWAAGSDTESGQADGAYILQAQGGKWVEPAESPCGGASAGLPPVILQDGCVS